MANNGGALGRADAYLTDRYRQIAHMKLAGVKTDHIASILEITQFAVNDALNKPAVQKYMLHIEAQHIEDIAPRLRQVSEAIADSAEEARVAVLSVMRTMLDNPGPNAQRVALSSAQDILDRAGHKAPIRVEEAKVHAVHPETLAALGDVIREISQARGGVAGSDV